MADITIEVTEEAAIIIETPASQGATGPTGADGAEGVQGISGDVTTLGTTTSGNFASFTTASGNEIQDSGYNTTDFSDLITTTSGNTVKLATIEEGAEVNNISDVNATDLTDAGDSALHYHSTDRNRANHTGTQTADTISDFDTTVSGNSAVTANTAKETNATHTGEVTGAGALTIADNVVDEANLKLDEAPTNDYVLVADSTKSGGMKWAANSAGFSDPMTTRGDIIARNSSNTTARFALGTNGQLLSSDGTDLVWADATGGGNVTAVNTPVDNDFAKFTSGTNIEGRSYAEVKSDLAITASDISDFDTTVSGNSAVAANTAKVGVTDEISELSEDSSPQLGGDLDANSYAIVASDHTTTSGVDQVVNVCYGTGDAPTASTTTIGSLYIKYTA